MHRAIPAPGWAGRAVAGVRVGDAVALGALVLLGAWALAASSGTVTLVALGLAGATAVASPAAAVAAAVPALPVAHRLLPLGGAAFGPLELAIGLGALGTGSRLLWRPRGWRRWAAGALSPAAITVPALVLLVVATVSLLTVADPGHRRESLREYRLVIVEPLVFLLLARPVVRSGPSRRLLVGAFVLTGVVVGVWAVAQVALHRGGVSADGFYRARVGFPHPNNLAFFLERVVAFAAGAAVVAWPGGRSRPAAVAALVAAAGLAATLSRGAFVAIAAGMVMVLVLRGARRGWIVLGVGAVVVAVALAAVAGERVLAAGGSGRLPTRLLIWRSSLEMGLDRPVWGVGLDQFLYQYWRRYVSPAGWPERYTSHPHNLVLDLWLRLGILGPVVFGWLAAGVARVARRGRADPSFASNPTAVGALAALAAGLAHGLVDNAFFLPDLAVMTWLFVALVESAPPPPEPTRPGG